MSSLSVSCATLVTSQRFCNPAVCDMSEVMDRVGHDHLLLIEITNLLEQDASVRIAELRMALSWFDVRAFEQAAHALKGMLANFAAKAAFDTASALEEIGRSRRWMNAGRLITQLEHQVKELIEKLNRFEMEKA
jgi:HPt (histidine-containing phosphotransfer) domain-containing protein